MFVRTKEDRIIKIDENGYVKEFDMFGKKVLFAFKDKNYSYRFENGKEVINQSESLEKLCDEFVGIVKSTSSDFIIMKVMAHSLKELKDSLKTKLNGKTYYSKFDIIYGAIWTSKGLIYVAKMNDKGELKLI